MDQQAPVKVIRAYEPTPQDLAQQRLDRCRPRDTSVAAVQEALEAINEELRVANWRFTQAREHEDRLLISGNIPEIQRARSAIETAGIAVSQFERMRDQMITRLARAEAEEAQSLRALEASLPAAEAAVRDWETFVARYHVLAAEIAAGLNLEHAAVAAFVTLRSAAHRLPDRKMPAPLPAWPRGGSLASSLSLPGHTTVPPPRPAGHYG